MSKKSRRRNKKILAALALAGGAAMLGRRGKGAVTGVVNPNEATQVAKDAGADIAEAVVPNTSSFKPRVWPGTMLNERGPKIINPNIDNPYVRIPPGGMRRFKKGGHVKSMGKAKRGGGAAIR